MANNGKRIETIKRNIAFWQRENKKLARNQKWRWRWESVLDFFIAVAPVWFVLCCYEINIYLGYMATLTLCYLVAIALRIENEKKRNEAGNKENEYSGKIFDAEMDLMRLED